MLTMRLIGVRDYGVFDDGQHIGRIRYASERNPGVWIWHVQSSHSWPTVRQRHQP